MILHLTLQVVHRADIISRAEMLHGLIGRKMILSDNLKIHIYWQISGTCWKLSSIIEIEDVNRHNEVKIMR